MPTCMRTFLRMNVVQSFGAEDETKEIFENLTDEHRNAFVDAVIFADMFTGH